MDRREFVCGLIGVTGIAAIGGVVTQQAIAAPVASPAALQRKPEQLDAPEAPAARAPDGTPIDLAQYGRRRRRWRRRRRRMVCRTRWIRGRVVRRCHWVWGW
jgi:hypothetical protein